ncbi:MAG: DUF2945 domain-containing protein [Nitrospira sp.]|nr:DUF2945 domain-containing protein [Nitrospira sp.]
MAKTFKVGDHVSWNSKASRVSGIIIAIPTSDFNYKGRVHHASADDPQYEIKSDRIDHIAAHKGNALQHTPWQNKRVKRPSLQSTIPRNSLHGSTDSPRTSLCDTPLIFGSTPAFQT